MGAAQELRAGDPEAIGGYRLTGRLGEGGQGVVYLAEDGQGGQVAVKALRREFVSDADARRRFVRELEAARQVAAFCTARIIEADVEGPQPFIVSEYVPGSSLDKVVRDSGPLEGPALDRLAIGTATALTAIHQAGIVHRDFKPGNVLLGPDGPRVIDFGIARALDTASSMASGIVGTPAYMAPEQLAGTHIGPNADMFAWGATLAFAATGRSPFGQDTIPAIINRVINATPDLTGLTGELHDLVQACLAKDPAQRPSARDVLLQLLGHGAGTDSPLAEGSRAATAVLPHPDTTQFPKPPITHPPAVPQQRTLPPPIAPLPPPPIPPGYVPYGITRLPPPPRRRQGVPGCAVVILMLLAAAFGGLIVVSALANRDNLPRRTPTPTSTARIPTRFAGSWTGTVRQSDERYPIHVTLRSGQRTGTVTYPSLNCSGRWTVDSIHGDTLLLEENVTGGTCVNRGNVRLTKKGNRLHYEWRNSYQNYNTTPEATTDLHKE